MKSSLRLLFVLATAIAPTLPAWAQDADALLRQADRYRMSADHLQVETQVTTYKADGSLDRERQYTVFVVPGRNSLVLMRSPADKGQRVLMLGDDFWLLMPASQRPLRITPMQKLLGDASTGDIATLSWATDYSGRIVGAEPCAPDGAPGPTCIHLSLAASRKGVTYQRIELWLGQKQHEPVRAEFYVQSDKLAKQVRFVVERTDYGPIVQEMVLTDRLSAQRETRIRYLSRKERKVPDEWLNPMYLVNHPTLE